jgi:hypothetical protein
MTGHSKKHTSLYAPVRTELKGLEGAAPRRLVGLADAKQEALILSTAHSSSISEIRSSEAVIVVLTAWPPVCRPLRAVRARRPTVAVRRWPAVAVPGVGTQSRWEPRR